jgi:sugar lactone lactonase YvrE
MPLSFQDLVRFIIDGDPVNQGTINTALRDIDNNTRYLKEVFEAATLGSTVFARNVTVETDAAKGMPVYYNVSNSRFERAKAASAVDSSGQIVTADSGHVWGIVYKKHTSTSADLLLTGYADLDISAAVDGSVTAGLYYLSSSSPGKLVKQIPPVTVKVLQTDASGKVFVNPTFSDLLTDHTHHKVELLSRPAGDHKPPVSSGAHSILEPSTGWDTTVEGWLPASHTIFNDTPAPTGAKFGYNIQANSQLDSIWPPTPVENAYIEWDRGGETFSGLAGISQGDDSLVILDDNGIWWMTDCHDTVPWSKDYNTTGGKIYWANNVSDKIEQSNFDGSSQEDLITGLGDPEGVAIDESNKKIYWIDRANDKIIRADLDGTNQTDIVTGLNSAFGLIIDTSDASESNHKLYWVDAGGQEIKSSAKDGTSVASLFNNATDGISSPQDLALDTTGSGTLWWTDDGTNKVQKGNADGTGSPTDVITSLTTPKGIVLDVAASKVYWCDEGTSKIQRADLDGTNQEDLINSTDGLSAPRGLDIDLVANKIYWTDATTQKLQRAGKDIPGGEAVGSRTDIEDLITSLNTANFPLLVSEDNTVTGVDGCPVELPMNLDIWFTKLTFQTSNTVVTSLRTPANSKLTIKCLQNTTTDAVTGDLEIDVDFGLLVETSNSNGSVAIKEFNDSTQTFKKGLMVEAIRSSSNDLIISSDSSSTPTYSESGVADAHQGVLTIGLVKSILGNEIPIELVRLDGVTEENFQDVLGLGFPKGKDTEYRGQVKIPQSLGAAAPIKLKLRFWMLAFADSQDLPLTGSNKFEFSYRVIESLTTDNPIKALPTSDKTDVALPGTTASSYAVPKGSYMEIDTGDISINNATANDDGSADTSNGQTLLFTLRRKGSTDGYDGEIHVINQRAVLVK